jgi:hypothetical protein
MESAKRLVVMINAAIDGGTRPGAGIIFGLANDRVYIAPPITWYGEAPRKRALLRWNSNGRRESRSRRSC